MIYTLTRQPSTPEGTFGELEDADGNHLCYTVELPWDDNIPQNSCIPIGTYIFIPHNSSAHPLTWEITNVPNRSEILIHSANWAYQLLGCIGVGEAIELIEGVMGVTNSVNTLQRLREILPDTGTLIIK